MHIARTIPRKKINKSVDLLTFPGTVYTSLGLIAPNESANSICARSNLKELTIIMTSTMLLVMSIMCLHYVRLVDGRSSGIILRQWLNRREHQNIQDERPLVHLTCWTCANKTDNEACNDWAPDVICPAEHSVCKSIHHVNIVTMETESVTKTCSAPDECSSRDVGCHDTGRDDDVKRCVSCCTESYCNEAVPSNQLSAISLSVTSLTSTGSQLSHSHHIVLVVAILKSLLILTSLWMNNSWYDLMIYCINGAFVVIISIVYKCALFVLGILYYMTINMYQCIFYIHFCSCPMLTLSCSFCRCLIKLVSVKKCIFCYISCGVYYITTRMSCLFVISFNNIISSQ